MDNRPSPRRNFSLPKNLNPQFYKEDIHNHTKQFHVISNSAKILYHYNSKIDSLHL